MQAKAPRLHLRASLSQHRERGPTIWPVGNLFDAFIAPQWPRNWYGPVAEQCLSFGVRSLGEVLMRPLLPEAGGTIAAVECLGERRRAKLVPMLTNVGGSESPTSPAACERR